MLTREIQGSAHAAPHHPFWQDVAWQQRMNARILAQKTLEKRPGA